MKNSGKRENSGSKITRAALMIIAVSAGFSIGCTTTPDPADRSPVEFKAHYLDEGSTMKVEDSGYAGEGDENLTLLEKLKRLSMDLDVESEKNSLLAQELLTMRDARDQIKNDLEETKTRMINLNEEISAMQVNLTKQENELDQSMREKKDLLEKLVNLKIEKAKVEKELLKIKIAALSGEG
ncbi:MAG: hypothetical protein ABIK28_09390 [Planctomycetota bacterium]